MVFLKAYKEAKKYRETKDYIRMAGKPYRGKNYTIYTNYIVDEVVGRRTTTINPPSGQFFGNINGETVSGNMYHYGSGQFSGNINGETFNGNMFGMKPEMVEEFTQERVVTRKSTDLLKKWKDKLVRRSVNKTRYIEWMNELNKDEKFLLKVMINKLGFNTGVEEYTVEKYEREQAQIKQEKIDKKRQEDDARKALSRISIEKSIKDSEAELEEQRNKRASRFDAIHKSIDKRRIEEKKIFKELENWNPTAEEIMTNYRNTCKVETPYTGVEIRYYECSDKKAFAAIVTYEGSRKVIIATNSYAMRKVASNKADKLSEDFNLRKNKKPV